MNRLQVFATIASLYAIARLVQQLPPPARDWFTIQVIDPMFAFKQPQSLNLPVVYLQIKAQTDSPPAPHYLTLQPIDRPGFSFILELGNGIDDLGYYRTPVESDRAFGVVLVDGIYASPMAWDEPQGVSVLYEVQSGYIIGQRFSFEPF